MGNIFTFLKQFYLRNVVSRFEYDMVREEIYHTNKQLVTIFSFVIGVLFFVLFIGALFFSEVAPFLHNPILYLITFCFMAIIFTASAMLTDENMRYIMIFVYFFIGVVLGYATILGVWANPHNSCVSLIVIEFGAPMIFVDRVVRMHIFTFICITIFSVLAFIYKDSAVASVDIFNAVCFWFISLITAFYIVRIKIREFGLRQIIEFERDTDELTGLNNKIAFIKNAKKSIELNGNGILVILDLDSFKRINDTYGHFVGDNVLKLVSSCIKRTFRNSDLMGRFGGDEFIVFMNATENLSIAKLRCEELLRYMNETRIFPDDMKHTETIHASLGYAIYQTGEDFDSLFKKADKALYEAKNTGKDKICSFI